MHVTFDESNPSSTEKDVVDDNAEEEQQEEAEEDFDYSDFEVEGEEDT